VPDTPALIALEAAAEPVRLQILLDAASRNGHIRPSDAKRYLDGSPRSGTLQHHFSKLRLAGLLRRVSHGQYELTAAGELVARLDPLLRRAAAADGTSRGSDALFADALLPEGAELLAHLQRRLTDGSIARCNLRISRKREA
jgi:antitoxin (DNA-binding transcriptional repressor) of toxin-antitoxin stability system